MLTQVMEKAVICIVYILDIKISQTSLRKWQLCRGQRNFEVLYFTVPDKIGWLKVQNAQVLFINCLFFTKPV